MVGLLIAMLFGAYLGIMGYGVKTWQFWVGLVLFQVYGFVSRANY